MKKQLLKERFQELAGIKPLYENEDRKADHSSFEYDENQNDGDLPIPTAGQWVDGTEMTEDELDDYYQKMERNSPGEMHSIMSNNLGEAKDKYGRSIKSLSEEETSRPFVLDSRTIENLKHLTNFRGDEKIEELTGLANYILDTPSPSFEKK